MNYLFKALGGIPVSRRKGGSSLTEILIKKFDSSSKMALAITPEGTRARVSQWHTGFIHIAYAAKIPIVLGAIDASGHTFRPATLMQTWKQSKTTIGRLQE